MSKIKWIKISTDMFDDEKIRLILSLPEGKEIFYIWMRLLTQAGKKNENGDIFLIEGKPFDEKMLANIFQEPVDAVKNALNVLCEFAMVEILPDKKIRIVNWKKHQNVEGMEKVREQNRNRVQRKREKDKQALDDLDKHVTLQNDNDVVCNVTVTEQRESKREEEEREIDLDIDREGEIEREEDTLSAQVLAHYEKITGTKNIFSQSQLKDLIYEHGVRYCTLAIDKALKKNKQSIKYVDGILKNWKLEGYPILGGELNGGEGQVLQGSYEYFGESEKSEGEISEQGWGEREPMLI